MNMEYFIVLLRRSFGFIAVAYGLFITALYVARPIKINPVLAVVTADGKVVFSNDPNSGWQVPIFKDRLENLLATLWKYEQADFQSYAARYADFRKLLVSKSPAAKKASDMVLAAIGGKEGPIKTESSTVEVDWKSFEALPVKGGWLVQVKATKVVGVPSEEKKRHPYKIRATIVEGEHDAIYQINSFDILDVEQ